MQLGINAVKEKKLNDLEDAALDVLLKVLKGKHDVDDEASLAMKALNTVAKNRQTLTARCGIEFAMAGRVLDDKDIRAYVSASAPQIKKALTS